MRAELESARAECEATQRELEQASSEKVGALLRLSSEAAARGAAEEECSALRRQLHGLNGDLRQVCGLGTTSLSLVMEYLDVSIPGQRIFLFVCTVTSEGRGCDASCRSSKPICRDCLPSCRCRACWGRRCGGAAAGSLEPCDANELLMKLSTKLRARLLHGLLQRRWARWCSLATTIWCSHATRLTDSTPLRAPVMVS